MNRLATEMTSTCPSRWERNVVSAATVILQGMILQGSSRILICPFLAGLILVAAVMLPSGSLLAQETPVPETPLPQQGEAEVEAESFSKSLILTRDRVAERQLRQIAELSTRKDWTSIAQLLVLFLDEIADRNLAQEESDLVELEGVASSKESAVARLFDQLPGAGRLAVLRLLEPVARRQLTDAVKNQDAAALRLVARRYRGTDSGQEARTLLRHLQRDRGQVVESSDSPKMPARSASPELNIPEEEWNLELITPPVTRQTVLSMHHLLRQSGSSPFPTMHLATGEQALVVTLATRRVGINSRNGQILWSRDIPGYSAEWYRTPGNLGDSNRARLFSQMVARRVFGEAVSSRTTISQTDCYFLEPLPFEAVSKVDEDGKEIDSSSANAIFSRTFPANQLICCDPASGIVRWTQSGSPSGSLYFAGTPTIQDGAVWILGESQHSKTLTLFQFDALSGAVISQLPFAIAKLGIDEDTRRRDVDCQVLVERDQVICPTAAGGLFAIDRLTGEILWAHRFPRRDAVRFPAEFDEIAIGTGFEHWNGWQTSRLLLSGNTLVSVSPEQEKLVAIDRQSGRSRWSAKFEAGLDIVMPDDLQAIVVFEKTAAHAHNLNTGEQLWRTVIPQPAGHGFVLGSSYVFPILNAGLAQLELKTGEIQTDRESVVQFAVADGVLPHQMRPRNLALSAGKIYEIHADGIQQLPQSLLVDDPALEPGSTPAVLQAVNAGDFVAATTIMREQLGKDAGATPATIRNTLLKFLSHQHSLQKSPQAREQIVEALNLLSLTLSESAAWRRQQAESAILRHDFKEFTQLWLAAPADEILCSLSAADGQSRARLDRWFQQTAAALPTELFSSIQTEVDVLTQSLSEADRGNITERLGQTSWGQSLRIQSPPAPRDIRSLLLTQLRLLEQAEAGTTELAAAAAYRMFRLYQSRDNKLDAARWLNRLAHFPPELQLPESRQVSELCRAEIGPFQESLDRDPGYSAWPTSEPQVVMRNRASREQYLVPLQIQHASESGFERIAVELDYPAHAAVRFTGGRWTRPWYAAIPKSTRNYRLDPTLDQGWCLEQLLILQTGSELYGISPFDFQGGTKAANIWPQEEQSIDTLGERENLMMTNLVESRPQHAGFHSSASRRLDEFEHYLTAVGPVTAGYICFQQNGMLVTIDPATGNELWRRYDLPRRAECYGNSRHIFVMSPESESYAIYSVFDGRLVNRRNRQQESVEVVAAHLQDLIQISGQPGHDLNPQSVSQPPADETGPAPPVIVTRRNLESGEIVWQRKWQAMSIPFELDDQWMGVVVAENQIEMIDLLSGKTVAQHECPLPEKLERIYACVTEEDLLIIFSDPVDQAERRKVSQIRGGFRRPWINGSVLCLDRQTCAQRWFQSLGLTEIPLDQPTEFPILITAEGRNLEYEASSEDLPEDAPPREQKSGVLIRCYDRKRGNLLQEIFHPEEQFPSYTVQGSRKDKNIRLQTLRTRLEINYLPRIEERAVSPEN